MFLQINHQKLDVFAIAKSFTLECYRFTKLLPSQERFKFTVTRQLYETNIQQAFKNVRVTY